MRDEEHQRRRGELAEEDEVRKRDEGHHHLVHHRELRADGAVHEDDAENPGGLPQVRGGVVAVLVRDAHPFNLGLAVAHVRVRGRYRVRAPKMSRRAPVILQTFLQEVL